ncbi:hypothetical protein ARMSODRAFT_1088695 [Armillaria solidipes]|uniref:Uncharacterized protein n=1 Tax=Armillaria solidipes TaxID=1076256 RepID=A0A2H3BEY3_9AGAR|nr:hypothetical protein ARMSODRAFT_1088695 [Armillaria solidipes]
MSYSRQIIPDSHYLQIACWWEGTGLHKRFICAVPLLPHSPCPIGVLQSTPLHIDTQAHLPVNALMNITRGALGGFYILRKFCVSQDPTRMVFFGIRFMATTTALAPTKNIVPVSMTSMAHTDDEEIRVNNRTAYIRISYPKEARCPFAACLAPKAHHIIDRRHGEAFEVLLSLSHSIVDSLDSCYPYTGPETRITQSTGLLHPSFPIPTTKSVELCLLGGPEVVIYEGEAFWIHGETCPLFETYGWYPQMLPNDRKACTIQRKPLKVVPSSKICERVVLEVSGQLPPEKRKAGRHRKRVRYQSESDFESNDEDEDEDDLEEKEAEYRCKSMQSMMIWLSNCWFIQSGCPPISV